MGYRSSCTCEQYRIGAGWEVRGLSNDGSVGESDRRIAYAVRWVGRSMPRIADGAWWEVTLAPHPDIGSAVAIVPVDSVLDAGLASLPPCELCGQEGVYAVKKRQLSRREAVRLGLTGPRAGRQRDSRAR